MQICTHMLKEIHSKLPKDNDLLFLLYERKGILYIAHTQIRTSFMDMLPLQLKRGPCVEIPMLTSMLCCHHLEILSNF